MNRHQTQDGNRIAIVNSQKSSQTSRLTFGHTTFMNRKIITMNAIAGSRATKAYVFLFLCGCLWAGNAIAGKLAVGHVSPFALTFGRWLIAVVIIAPFAIPHVRKEWQTVRANIVFLTMLGLFGFTLFNNLLYTALKYTSAINVSIEQASLPLTVFLFSFLLFGERATWNQL